MKNIPDTHISYCLYKSVARRNGYCFGSSKLERKIFTRGPREFGGSLLQNLSSMTDMLVICKICAICKIFNLAAPPARALYLTMGPDRPGGSRGYEQLNSGQKSKKKYNTKNNA